MSGIEIGGARVPAGTKCFEVLDDGRRAPLPRPGHALLFLPFDDGAPGAWAFGVADLEKSE